MLATELVAAGWLCPNNVSEFGAYCAASSDQRARSERETADQIYLHAGGPGIHAGVKDSDEHASAIILGEPGEIRSGASFFFGEQPVEGERFFVRMGSHDSKERQ